MKFNWVTLYVNNLNESLEFYQEIVGLNIVNRFPGGPGVEIVFLGDGETKVELIFDKNLEPSRIGSGVVLGFGVDSLDKMMEFVKEKGVRIHSGPFEPSPNTKFFFVEDPNGVKVQFVEQNLTD